MKRFLSVIALSVALLTCVAQTRFSLIDQLYNVSCLDMKSGMSSNNVNAICADSEGFIWISTYGGGLLRYDGFEFHEVGGDGSKACRNVCEDAFGRLWVAYYERMEVIDLRTLMPTVPTCGRGDLDEVLSQRLATIYRDSEGRIWVVGGKDIFLLSFNAKGEVSDIAKCAFDVPMPEVAIADVDRNGKVWMNSTRGLVRIEKSGDKLLKKPVDDMLGAFAGIYVTSLQRQGRHVWIGTSDGLYRYDGTGRPLKRFTHTAEAGSLSHNHVTSLLVDDDNNLLVGTLNGVNFYREETGDFDAWNPRSDRWLLPSPFVKCMLVHNCRLWIGTENGGLVRLTPRQLVVANFRHSSDPSSLSANIVNSIYVEPNGRAWVGCVEGGLNRLDRGSGNFIHYDKSNTQLPHNTVSTLAADKDGRLWIGTWGGGVCSMSLDEPGKIERLRADGEHEELLRHVGALAYDERNGGLWIGTNAGMFFYDYKSGQVTDPFDGCRDTRGCIGALIDTEGQLWMGYIYGMKVVDLKSNMGGQFKVRTIDYRPDHPGSGQTDHIVSFCQADDGTIWLGSNLYGLYRRTVDKRGKEVFQSITTADGLPNNSIKGIAEDGDGRLWITTPNGLVVYSVATRTFTNYTEDDGLVSSEFYWNSIVERGGRFYLGTRHGFSIIEGEPGLAASPGRLHFTGLTVDNNRVGTGSRFLKDDITVAKSLRLHESNKSFSIDFSALDFGGEKHGAYAYRLKGLEKDWAHLKPGEHSVRYSALPAGTYTFEVRYTSALEPTKEQRAEIEIVVEPHFYRSWWFLCLLFACVCCTAIYMIRWRVRAMNRQEAENALEPIRQMMSNVQNPQQFMQSLRKMLHAEEKYGDSLSKSLSSDRERQQSREKPFLDRAMEVLERNFSDSDFGIEALCREMGMSRTQMNKKLNAATGMSLSHFIRNYRLNVAREMMADNRKGRNITEIAYSVGFNDPKYFTRCFTKHYGITPSECQAGNPADFGARGNTEPLTETIPQ